MALPENTPSSADLPSSRRRSPDGKPRAADAYVGHRLRTRRTVLGMSQESVAAAIGLTLQQIQKYENGTNRVGASRLWDLAQVLGCDVAYFFEGFDENAERPVPQEEPLVPAEAVVAQASGVEPTTTDPIMIRRETWELVRAYYLITDGRVRRRLRNLACSLAAKEEMLANSQSA
jgi:transcriptional regulator with XRE-family HTH domain